MTLSAGNGGIKVCRDGPQPLDGDDGERAVMALSAAYMSIERGPRENFALWAAARHEAWRIVESWYTEQGLWGPRWQRDFLKYKVAPTYPSNDPGRHVRFVEAMAEAYREGFEEQFDYRLATEGNILLAFRGPTGYAKSSAAANVADAMSPMAPERLTGHFAYDMTELPAKLKLIQRGEAVILDENVRLAGEGARTAQSLLENLEDTIRESGKSLFVCTPGDAGEGLMEAELEALLWDRKKKYTLFMFYYKGIPMGLVPISWMRDDLYAAYLPWKRGNTERSISGKFRDPAYYPRMVLRLFEDERFVNYLMSGKNKPRKASFKDAFNLYFPQMMAASQAENVVAFAHSMVVGFSRTEKTFARDFHGLEPNEGLKRVAMKWYKE